MQQNQTACDVLDTHEAGALVYFTGLPGDSTAVDGSDNLKHQLPYVSHQLRTCLSIITFLSGNLDLLYERLDDEKRRRTIRDIRKHIQKLNSFVEEMLDMSDGEVTLSV